MKINTAQGEGDDLAAKHPFLDPHIRIPITRAVTAAVMANIILFAGCLVVY